MTPPLNNTLLLRKKISGNYAPYKNRFGRGVRTNTDGTPRNHSGIDLLAVPGTPIYAIGSGELYWKNTADYGLQLLLEFEPGLFAHYAHLSQILAEASIGDAGMIIFHAEAHHHHSSKWNLIGTVQEGDEIGQTGKSGNACNMPTDEDHLHFEIRKTKKSTGLSFSDCLNPENYFWVL